MVHYGNFKMKEILQTIIINLVDNKEAVEIKEVNGDNIVGEYVIK